MCCSSTCFSHRYTDLRSGVLNRNCGTWGDRIKLGFSCCLRGPAQSRCHRLSHRFTGLPRILLRGVGLSRNRRQVFRMRRIGHVLKKSGVHDIRLRRWFRVQLEP